MPAGGLCEHYLAHGASRILGRMGIEWNRVTWYSKLLAIVVFVATFAVAFNLGILWEETQIGAALSQNPTSGGGAGAHCGGFIRNAPVCAAGYHCVLNASRPDTSGTCAAD